MDTERVIGELKEFKRATLSDLADLKRDVKALHAFRWKAMGSASVVAFVISILVEVVRK